eukprot:TRINITY_DN38775_c0_g1_i1.p1 TRINITY_DN38775_c0_g1~~TRINITY_DN38775_c0_g1_i1.p1  ORF type:complete len:337 (-),score=64.24 TRINITY_DN38775_c0_g1_i1:146-1156(-)
MATRLGALPSTGLSARAALQESLPARRVRTLASTVAPAGLAGPIGGQLPAGTSGNALALRAVGAASLAFLARAAAPRSSSRRHFSVVAAASSDSATEVDAYLKAKIEEMVALRPVMVFSKSWCPFCTKAKEALESQGVKFAVCELDTLGPDVEGEVQEILSQLTGARTVPRVFIGGECIGGGTDTARLAAEGTLKKIADDAVASNREKVSGARVFQLQKSDEEWQASLSAEKFRILRRRGTEPPGSHEYDQFLPKAGHFACAGCELPLYSADSKFASTCGWPVFDKCYGSTELGQHVIGQPDGTGSLEIVCANCGSHLGHVFYDSVTESNPNGERH